VLSKRRKTAKNATRVELVGAKVAFVALEKKNEGI
jgi:hypothetical protein